MNLLNGMGGVGGDAGLDGGVDDEGFAGEQVVDNHAGMMGEGMCDDGGDVGGVGGEAGSVLGGGGEVPNAGANVFVDEQQLQRRALSAGIQATGR